jgi:hypothetical protein
MTLLPFATKLATNVKDKLEHFIVMEMNVVKLVMFVMQIHLKVQQVQPVLKVIMDQLVELVLKALWVQSDLPEILQTL